MAIASDAASKAISEQAAETLKLNIQLYDQAQAYERTSAAGKAAADNSLAVEAAQSKASAQTAIYNQYIYDQAQALLKTLPAQDAHIQAYNAEQQRLAAVSAQTAIYNQYLYDQAVASERAAAAMDAHLASSLSTTRNALKETSRGLSTLALGLLAIPVITAVVASKYQRDFANVERATLITGEAAANLKKELIDLSTQIPLSFKDITDIATAGAQLGIDPSGLQSFTRVVAELTATTNLTADAAENLLGKFSTIAGVAPSQFKNLASAVLNVGVNTASTELQIAKLGTQLVGIGKQAGLTVPQIIGIAGGISSVSASGVELSRGALTQFFGLLGKAADGGGKSLAAFTTTAGITAAQFKADFGTDRFAGDFQAFFDGLNKIQKAGGDARGVLEALGVTSVRYTPILLNLASGSATLAKAIQKANEGYADGSILNQHYQKINETLSAQATELVNKFLKLGDTLGQLSNGPLNNLVKSLSSFVDDFTKFAEQPANQTFLIIAADAAVLLGALALLGSGISRIVAGGIALRQAYTGLSALLAIFGGTAATAAGGVDVLAASEAGASAATVTLRSRLAGLLVTGTAALSIFTALAIAAQQANSAAGDAAAKAIKATGGSAKLASQAKTTTSASFVQGDTANRGFGGSFIGDQINASNPAVKSAAAQQSAALKTIADAAAKAKKEVSDLKTAGENYFAGGAKGAEALAAAYTKALGPLNDFNSIVGEVQSDNQKLKPDYDGTSVSLDQYTKRLQDNNVAGAAWLANIKTIASSYGSDVANQFVAAGYSVTNASILAQLTKATPAQAAAYSAATTTAINQSSQAAGDALISAGQLVTAKGGQIGTDTAQAIGKQLLAGFSPAEIMAEFNLQFAANPAKVKIDLSGAQYDIDSFIKRNSQRVINIPGTALPSRLVATGGPISGPGTGTSDSIPARLSNGEYVIRASAVRQYGTGMFDALNRGVARFAGGGSVGGGSSTPSVGMSVVELGPRSMGVLRDSLAKEMSVYLGDVHVAQAANRGNKQLNAMGVQ